MRFNPLLLARAWQSIDAATGTDKTTPQNYRAIIIETHKTGMFIAGHDGYLMLHAWVPNHTHTVYDPAPDLDDEPDQVVVVCDPSHRALSLLSYVGKIVEDDEVDPDDYLVAVEIENAAADSAFPGMETHIVTFAAAGETVTLDTWDGAPYPWRDLQTGALKSIATTETSLPPRLLTKLVKAAKPHGDLAAVSASFGGLNKPITVEIVDSEPYICGVAMPLRIQTVTDVEVA